MKGGEKMSLVKLKPEPFSVDIDGDEYEYFTLSTIIGDYKYIFDLEIGGWSVHVLDKTKMEYGPIEDEINGIPVRSLDYTFHWCKNLRVAPAIPKSVTHMSGTFVMCENLEDVSKVVIPDAVFYTIEQIFGSCCKKLTAYPKKRK